MSDYWSNFNNWKNTTGADVVHSNGKEGDTADHITGSSWMYQDGDTTSYQTGNVGSKQIGVSNSLIEGCSFFTVLGMNIKNTVGIGIDNCVGARVVMTGAAVEVTLGTTARVSLGPIYDRGTERFRVSSGPSYDIADERYDCATGCEEVIVEDRRMIAKDIYLYAANELEDNAMKRTIVGYASVTLEAPEVELKSTLKLNAKTTGAMLLTAANFDVDATIAVRIMAKGLIKLG
ncbi:MAG: hypothetical protein DWH80_08125 [Planctomycetota bacterium]|nr:MAG: hypothetical protein DWH80_08125 [Planctomycetota bacterium]